MKLTETVQSEPIATVKSNRQDIWRGLTSADAGKVVPLAYFPLLREDQIVNGTIACTVEMGQTVHPLINAVNARFYAHLIPFSAFERFDGGMNTFNRSYRKVKEPTTNSVVPFFKDHGVSGGNAFYNCLGIHRPAAQGGSNPRVNQAVVEAYNLLVNWRRRARSNRLDMRHETQGTLAEAFWHAPILHDIVPDYEEALLDGEIGLTFTQDQAPISGLYVGVNDSAGGGNTTRPVDVDGTVGDQASGRASSLKVLRDGSSAAADVLPQVFAELGEAGVKLSLSNIELAKQTVAFAKLRQEYAAIPEDHLIDLLMQGIRIPPEALRQPLLLARQDAPFTFVQRQATDGDNLDMSRTEGVAAATLTIRTPPINTGGIVLITCEVTPEPLFERMYDPFLGSADQDDLPDFLRDFLDPKKVTVVPNKYVDVLHGDPETTFGYRGLNREWDRNYTRIGGKFMRAVGDPFVEDRQRFWSVERQNPVLAEDFYLVKSLPKTIFADQVADSFEFLTVGKLNIRGNTVFGRHLVEDDGAYQSIVDYVTEND